jgi:2-dehydropantoate 2-reductase
VNITILGPGAIGSLYAYRLNQAGHSVSLWGRAPSNSIELSVDSLPPLTFANQDTQKLQHCDLLIVTLKAWQVETALSPILEMLHQDAIILFLHNGMGTVERLQNQLHNRPVLLGTTTHGALRVTGNQIRHTGQGQTLIGAWNALGQQCQFVADVLDHAITPAKWHDSIQTALWTKLVINCAINPLTATLDCQNGQLTRPEYRSQLSAIVSEAVMCAQTQGIGLDDEALLQTVLTVAQATAENYSSMHQDIYNKRQSEIDFITGYLLDIAQQNQLAVPQNATLFQHIKQIEASWSQHD